MIKVFISQPMRGLFRDEIRKNREKIIDFIKKQHEDQDIEIIDNIFDIYLNNDDITNKALLCLGKSLIEMSKADVCYFTSNYKEFRGCKIEYQAAMDYGIPAFIINDDVLV